MAEKFFWLYIASDIRRFVNNCDVCRRGTVWRELKHGLLKPFPIAARTWQELSVNFIVDLLSSFGRKHFIIVTDRLGKSMILVLLKKLDARTIA